MFSEHCSRNLLKIHQNLITVKLKNLEISKLLVFRVDAIFWTPPTKVKIRPSMR